MRLLIVLAVTWLTWAAAGAALASEAGDRCAALKAFAWPHLKVEEARLVAAGPADAAGAPPLRGDAAAADG